MAFIFRTVDDLIADFFTSLKESGSKLAEAAVNSRVYYIARAVGSVVGKGYSVLQDITDSFFVMDSTGDILRKRVKDEGMIVDEGEYAVGAVVAYAPIGQTTSLSVGEVLFAEDSTLQFRVLQATTLGAIPVQIPISAVDIGSRQNLQASTPLYSSRTDLQGAKFLVSYYPPENGIPKGDLRNGRDAETSDEIKARFPAHKRSYARAVEFAVDSALRNIPELNLVALQRATPAPGYFTVVLGNEVSELTDAVKAKIAETFNSWASIGDSYEIVFLERRVVNLTVNVLISDSKVAPAAVESALRDALGTLQQGQSLYRSAVVKAGMIDGVVTVEVVKPVTTEEVLQAVSSSQVIVLGEVKVYASYV